MIVLPSASFLGRNQLEAFARSSAARQRPDFTISGYPEYASSIRQLDSKQQLVLKRAAIAVVNSQESLSPAIGLVVVGHADKAQRIDANTRGSFELEVSRKRASSARESLTDLIREFSSGAFFAKVLRSLDFGIGSATLAVEHPTTEQQMRLNRRVEIWLLGVRLSNGACFHH